MSETDINTAFTYSYSKSKIIEKSECGYVNNITFATIKFTSKVTVNGKKKKQKISCTKDVVIKYYPNTKLGSKELLNEVAILDYIDKNINDPNLVVPKSLAYKVRRKKPHVHYIERIVGNDLEYWDKNLFTFKNHPTQAFQITLKIAKALQVLHQYNIAHRDIKPENIIMSFENNKINIALIDVAYSKIITDVCMLMSCNYCGTPLYASPELCRQQVYNLMANDIWSFGATIYAMYTQQCLPMSDQDKLSAHFEICRLIVNSSDIPEIIKIILRKIFVPQNNRITIDCIVSMLVKSEHLFNDESEQIEI